MLKYSRTHFTIIHYIIVCSNRPAHPQTVYLEFRRELQAYQALTLVTGQRENEVGLVRRENEALKERLVPRLFLTGNSAFGKKAMTAILD